MDANSQCRSLLVALGLCLAFIVFVFVQKRFKSYSLFVKPIKSIYLCTNRQYYYSHISTLNEHGRDNFIFRNKYPLFI